ncbi:MAG TPA: hypothetical protein VMD75_17335 [Candidatus Binataceae bacterium]|nr:hypothetical protein [Candidatus Binataceae bacterium]
MQLKSFLATTLVLFLACPAWAQTSQKTPPKWFRGTVKKLNGQALSVMLEDGRDVSFTLAPKLKIVANVRRTLADIRPGDFVGSAGIKEANGKLYAQEVHIFPEDMRGTAEGQRPMGPNPERNMTNASVSAVASRPARSMTNATVTAVTQQGGILKLKYKGGEAETIVRPGTPIVAFVPGDRSLLKTGATVLILAIKNEQGWTAVFVNAEKDGVMPLRL